MTSRKIEDAALKGKTCCVGGTVGGVPYACGAPAKTFRDSIPYCLRHDPVRAAERKAKTAAELTALRDAEEARHDKAAHLRACERAVVEAAEKWNDLKDHMLTAPFTFGCACDELEAAVAAYREARGK